jgi:rhomboid-like protein
MASLLGASRFVTLYLTSGVTASIASIAYHRWSTQRNAWWYTGPSKAAHGASGSLLGAATVFTLMFPRAQLLLFFILPVPAWLALGGIVANDVYHVVQNKTTMFDHAGHLGGVAGGLAVFMLWAARIIRR